MSLYIKLLKILGIFKFSCLEFDDLSDRVFEDIVYDKPYFTQCAGVLHIFMNFSFDKMKVYQFTVKTEHPEQYVAKLCQNLAIQ